MFSAECDDADSDAADHLILGSSPRMTEPRRAAESNDQT